MLHLAAGAFGGGVRGGLWGAKTRIRPAVCGSVGSVNSFVLYLVVSVLARLVASSGDADSKDIKILVLPHQLKVLRMEGRTAEAPPERPCPPRRCGPSAPPGPVDIVPGHSVDAASLAP